MLVHRRGSPVFQDPATGIKRHEILGCPEESREPRSAVNSQRSEQVNVAPWQEAAIESVFHALPNAVVRDREAGLRDGA
jgi:hypothetical protein